MNVQSNVLVPINVSIMVTASPFRVHGAVKCFDSMRTEGILTVNPDHFTKQARPVISSKHRHDNRPGAHACVQ